jgi:asparagine synthase (glutamine-hydrolysing)
VKTFAIGFAEDERSELKDAREVASVFGADHTEVELSFRETVVPLEDLMWHLDEPVADLSTLGFHALCRVAAKDVTVALSGQGADELFGGYRKHQAAWAVGKLHLLPQRARAVLVGAARFGPEPLRRLSGAVAASDPAGRLLSMSGDLDQGRRGSLYAEALGRVDGGAARRAVEARLDGVAADGLSEMLFLDAQLALPDLMLHYFDRTSMAHSLEVRVPFLDHELVELSARIPSAHKIKRGATKVLLRHVARGIVPDRIIDKPKIGFFVGAADEWLRAQFATEARERLLGGALVGGNLIDRGALEGLVADFAERRAEAPRARLLLSLLMLEVWLSSYLPRVQAHAAPVP